MKRTIAVLLAAVLIFAIVTFIFIPSTLKISAVNLVSVNSEAAFRLASQPGSWYKWIGNTVAENDNFKNTDSSFLYNGQTFCLNEIMHNAARIAISDGTSTKNSLFSILPVSKDSSVLKWETEMSSGLNPVLKIIRYRRALAIKNNISAIMDNMQHFLEKQENVYGSKFHVASTDDTLLVAIKENVKTYPQTEAVYKTIKGLQNYVAAKGCKQTAPPMMNATRQNDDTWQIMIALPVDKAINVERPYLFRKLVKGNFLITKITGGDSDVNNALEMMKLYINDYGKTVMAIPFQRLVTDRSIETDTSKWITEIYYPVIR